MQIREIEEALRKPGKSKSGLAAALGRKPSAVTDILQGKREIKAREIPVIRDYLDLRREVPVVGRVGAGSEAHFYAEGQGTADMVPAPDWAGPQTVAVEIKGQSLGAGFDGWVAFYDDRRDELTPDICHHLCVVGLDDGRVLIKIPKPSRTPGYFHLEPGAGGETIYDARVLWAASVKGILPREAIK